MQESQTLLERENESLTVEVETLQSQNAALQGDIKRYELRTAEQQTEIAELTKKVETLEASAHKKQTADQTPDRGRARASVLIKT